jgi:hypothetical protein
MSKLEVDAIEPQSGTTLTLGASGDTVNIASGATNNLGITEADQWRVNTAVSLATSVTDITSNWERVDTDGFGYIGTGMSQSSGIFTFPSTGVYLVSALGNYQGAAANYIVLRIYTTTDDSTYGLASDNNTFTTGSSVYSINFTNFIFNVTNTTTHKIKFAQYAQNSGVYLQGQTDSNSNSFTFIRLGNSV